MKMMMMMMMIYDFQQNFMEPEVVVYIAVRNYSIFVSGVFKISGGGGAMRRCGGVRGGVWGEGCAPSPEKKSRHSRSLETTPLSRACVLTLNNIVTLKFGSAIHLKCSKDSFSWYNQ